MIFVNHRKLVACTAPLLLLGAQSIAAAAETASSAQAIVELEPYTVVSTATRTSRLLEEAAIRTEFIEPDLFRSVGARDLASALEYLPGLRTEANCQNCGTSEIKMRGLGADYNQLLFDGQPLFCGLASVYGIEHIPTSTIGRIEVVKGGASSLYGAGAVAGVVNVMPHQPTVAKQRYDLSIESVKGEPASSLSVLKDWASETSDVAFSLYGQVNDSAAVDINGDGFTEITEKDFKTFGLSGWSYPGENGRLSGHYAYSWEKRRGGNALALLPHEAQISEQLEHNWHRGGLTWEGGEASGVSYRFSGSVSHIDRASYYGGVGSVDLPGQPHYDSDAYQTALEASRLQYGYSDTTRFFMDAFFSRPLQKRDLSWGVQYQIDEVFDEKRDERGRALRSNGTVARFSGEDPIIDRAYANLGLFLQDEWMPTPATTVVSGLRADQHSELDDWIVSPRIALRQALGENWTWRASITTGFRAPETFDEDLHIEILEDPTRTHNAPNLQAERSTSYSGGFVWTPDVGGRRVEIDAELYRTDIRDTFHVPDIVFLDSRRNAFKERVNAGGSTVQGFEVNGAYRLGEHWSAEAGFAYVDARFDSPQEALPGVFEDRHLETPQWTGSAQLKYENDRFLNLFLRVGYTGPMIAARESAGTLNRSTADFFVIDLTFAKHIHWTVAGRELHIDLMAGVKNLLDERQPDLTRGPDRDATYFYGPRFPRSVVTSVGVSW